MGSHRLPGHLLSMIVGMVIVLTLACGQPPAGGGAPAPYTEEVADTSEVAPRLTATKHAPLEPEVTSTIAPTEPRLLPTLTSVPFLPAGLAVITPANAARLETLADITQSGAGVIAFSHDSRYLAVGLFKANLVKVYDLESGKELYSLGGHVDTRVISYLSFSPDGDRLASGAQAWDAVNDSLILWDAASGSELKRYDGVLGALSPDWRTLALSEREQEETTLVLTELASGNELHTLAAAGDIYDICFSPDGRRVAAKMYDPVRDLFAFWSVESGRLDLTAYDWSDFIYSTDGRFIAALLTTGRGADKGEVNIHDAATFKYMRTLRGDFDSLWYTYIAFSPDGSLLAASAGDHVTLWDTQSWKELASLPVSEKAGVIFSPDGRVLVMHTLHGPVQAWGVAGE